MPILSSEPFTSELEVVLAAERHEQTNKSSNGNYSRVFVLGNFVVKYSEHVSIMRECQALQNLYELAIKGGDGAPRVPQVVHYFHRPNGFGYMIMERIHLRNVSEDELCGKTAKAVLWLRAQQMDLFGSLGGANTCHTVFQRDSAPHPFTRVAAAQTYLNEVRVSLFRSLFSPACPDFSSTCEAVDRVRRRRQSWMKPIANINLTDDNVVLTQSDMNQSNFGVALDDGRPVIFDAATIQALPKTLADFTLLQTTSFAKAVSAYVFHPVESNALLKSPSFISLAEVRSYLSMSDDDLGKFNLACFSLGADTLDPSFFP